MKRKCYQGTATQGKVEPNIVVLERHAGNEEHHRALLDLPQLPALNNVPDTLGGGVVPVVEGLHQDLPGPLGGLHHLLRFLLVVGQRLLAEDVLPGLEGLDGPLVMQPIGGGDVDRLDLGVSQKGLVGGVHLGDLVLVGESLGLGLITSLTVPKRQKEIERKKQKRQREVRETREEEEES